MKMIKVGLLDPTAPIRGEYIGAFRYKDKWLHLMAAEENGETMFYAAKRDSFVLLSDEPKT